MLYCAFNEEYNKCEFLNQDNSRCNAKTQACAYCRDDKIKPPSRGGYVRKPRWYEKYYK